MRKTRVMGAKREWRRCRWLQACVMLLATILLLMTFPSVPTHAGTVAAQVVEVSTVAALKSALENDAGAQVRLLADITFTAANAADEDHGVLLGAGAYSVWLNGHTITYNHPGGNGDPSGVPLAAMQSRSLTIEGPGNLTGGTYGLEQGSRTGITTVNGGILRGVVGSGMRVTQGIAILNSGTVTGNFYGVHHEDGIVVLQGATVKSVVKKSAGIPQTCYGVIRDGVFTGHAVLEDVVLSVRTLTIGAGSDLSVGRNGGLVVDTLVTQGTFHGDSGLRSIGGNAMVHSDAQVSLGFDVIFRSLAIQPEGRLMIRDGAKVTVMDAFVNDQGMVSAVDGTLDLQGSIDHRGSAEGVPVLEALRGGGAQSRDYATEMAAATHLHELGLFQGVGTLPDGSPDYALTRTPTRVEVLVMLIRLLGAEEEALSGTWPHPFTDVPGWADRHVGYAYANGLTKGVSATSFGTGEASLGMYLTFVLRALGYSDAGGADFTWDAPETLAERIAILPGEVERMHFLRADVALVSDAALSARIKGQDYTLMEKLGLDGH